jgi:hypothetical protein
VDTAEKLSTIDSDNGIDSTACFKSFEISLDSTVTSANESSVLPANLLPNLPTVEISDFTTEHFSQWTAKSATLQFTNGNPFDFTYYYSNQQPYSQSFSSAYVKTFISSSE